MRSLFVTFLAMCSMFGLGHSKYNVDVLEARWNTTTPDVIDVEIRVVQVTRGVYGCSGHVYYKKPINLHRGRGYMKIYYSRNGITFQLSPFQFPSTPLSYSFNGPYRNYMMKNALKYCTDVPQEKYFTSPLRPYYTECENFIFPSENFPTQLWPGYYNVIMVIEDKPEMDMLLSFLLHIEQE